MLERFKEIIETFPVKGKKLNVLVAVSGGLDSTVLAHLCKSAEVEFSLAHCNFNLRGEESDLDQVFVEQLAEDLDVSLYLQSFDTVDQAEKKSKSIQLTARELRYGWFEDLVNRHQFDFLFSAHHLNDRVETTIFNYLRGAGVSGLRSIKTINEYIARPLIEFTRKDIELHAVVNNIKWREDSSNKSKKYTRNYIRHEVIPLFDEVHGNWEKAVSNTYKRLEQSEIILQELAHEVLLKLQEGAVNGINFKGIIKQAVLLELALKPLGFTLQQCQFFYDNVNNAKTHFEISTSKNTLIYDRGTIELKDSIYSIKTDLQLLKAGDEVTGHNYHIATSVISKESFRIQKGINNAYFDLEKIQFPITVGQWKQGDVFVPFGMKGKKKVSDFFIDQKVPLHLKEEVPVLKDVNGEIIWIAGYRQSNKFKIRENTSQVIIFHLI